MLPVCCVPEVGVAILTARDDSSAVGSDEDLLDDAISGRLGSERLAGGRVPAINGPLDGARQRFAVIGEMETDGFSVDAEPFFKGGRVV